MAHGVTLRVHLKKIPRTTPLSHLLVLLGATPIVVKRNACTKTYHKPKCSVCIQARVHLDVMEGPKVEITVDLDLSRSPAELWAFTVAGTFARARGNLHRNLRVFVEEGGAAYRSGLRTNDVVVQCFKTPDGNQVRDLEKDQWICNDIHMVLSCRVVVRRSVPAVLLGPLLHHNSVAGGTCGRGRQASRVTYVDTRQWARESHLWACIETSLQRPSTENLEDTRPPSYEETFLQEKRKHSDHTRPCCLL